MATNPPLPAPVAPPPRGETAQSAAPMAQLRLQPIGQQWQARIDNALAGAIQSGALEKSNVDLTNELVRMIEAQRIYQANAQAIETANNMTQTIVNLQV